MNKFCIGRVSILTWIMRHWIHVLIYYLSFSLLRVIINVSER